MNYNDIFKLYRKCQLCPHNCGIDRQKQLSFCSSSSSCKIAAALPHHWEEPIICSEKGSGTIFFSSCTLKCVYCQNCQISHRNLGYEIEVDELLNIYYSLAEKGVCNINLVTAEHFIPHIVASISEAKKRGFDLPFVLNTSSYINVSSLKMLDGLIDIYLPDLKFYSSKLSKKYCGDEKYPIVARSAIQEMYRQRPRLKFAKNGLLQEGLIARVLLLPGLVDDAKMSVSYLYTTYGDSIFISIMSQYTPLSYLCNEYPEINRKVSVNEYNELIDFAIQIGVNRSFIQEMEAASESFIPKFFEDEDRVNLSDKVKK